MRVFYLDSRTNKRLNQHSHLDSVDMGGGVGIWFSRPALTTACCAIDFNEDMDSEFCKSHNVTNGENQRNILTIILRILTLTLKKCFWNTYAPNCPPKMSVIIVKKKYGLSFTQEQPKNKVDPHQEKSFVDHQGFGKAVSHIQYSFGSIVQL